MSHTPTPWKSEVVAYDRDWAHISGGEWGWFAKVAIRCDSKPSPEGEANAAFIVKAVNAHDDLVAACQLAYADYEATEHGSPAFIALERALAKAGAL